MVISTMIVISTINHKLYQPSAIVKPYTYTATERVTPGESQLVKALRKAAEELLKVRF